MTNYKMRFIIIAVSLVLLSAINADPRLVPEEYDEIQWAIDVAVPGETVSVWGSSPPDTYPRITIDKEILVINRSLLPGQTPGYEPPKLGSDRW